MSKIVGVLFSGGLDSTYLLWKNLKEGNHVIPIYIEISNNINKSILEKNRVKLLHEKFSKEFNKDKYLLRDINYAVTVGVNASEDSLYFKQIPIWIFGAIFLQSMHFDEIQIGYVMNDDAISYLDEIKKIYNSYKGILDSITPLSFPLTKMKKIQMACELPREYLDLVVSCENPHIVDGKKSKIIEYEPCCDCPACRRVISEGYLRYSASQKMYDKFEELRIVREFYYKGFSVLDGNGENVSNLASLSKFEPYQLSFDFDNNLNEKDVDSHFKFLSAKFKFLSAKEDEYGQE